MTSRSRSDILFSYLADTKNLERGNKRARKSMGGVTDSAKKLGGALALAFGAREILQFAGDAIQLAVAAEEVDQKFKAVFGSADKFSEALSTWADMAGVTDTASRDLAATFGNLAIAQGISAEASQALTLDVATLAGDMGSFNDIDPQKVFFDLNKALLTTEREGMKKYGIAVTEAEVKTLAMARAVENGRDEANQADRAYASYAIVVRQAGKANGDLERTQDSLANVQRQLSAEVKELQEEIGRDLIPAYRDLMDIVIDLKPVLLAAVDEFGETATIISGVTSVVNELTSAFSELRAPTIDLEGALLTVKGTAEKLFLPLKALDFVMGKIGLSTDELGRSAKDLSPSMADVRTITLQYGESVRTIVDDVVELAGVQDELARATDKVSAAVDRMRKAFSGNLFGDAFKKRAFDQDLLLAGGVGSGQTSFATGGTVPGPRGKAQLAVVHGGERVTTPGNNSGGGGIVVNFNGVVGDPVAVAQQIEDLLQLNGRIGGRQ